MIFIGKKEEEIIRKFKEHVETVGKTLENFEDFVNAYLDGNCSDADRCCEKVMMLESKADGLRRETESMMYAGAFLPNFRGDLLGLIESVDRIADRAETVTKIISFQKPEIPPEIKSGIRKQVRLAIDTFKELKESIYLMFEDMEKAKGFIKRTEEKEHEEDMVEWDIMKTLFSLEIDRAQKLEIKEIITLIGDISDLAEDASDRVEIIILKRSV
ncbi:MAG: TIGR00153 family protein [Thermotogaceae bacterium]|nr:TIGR00153 family protein [Thermotogaceae bacterium]